MTRANAASMFPEPLRRDFEGDPRCL